MTSIWLPGSICQALEALWKKERGGEEERGREGRRKEGGKGVGGRGRKKERWIEEGGGESEGARVEERNTFFPKWP